VVAAVAVVPVVDSDTRTDYLDCIGVAVAGIPVATWVVAHTTVLVVVAGVVVAVAE